MEGIYINPNDVMKLSSPAASMIYTVNQSSGKDLPSDTAYTEEERLELNTKKPKYVSFSCTSKLDKTDKNLKRYGDFLLSVKVVEGDPNALFLISGDNLVRVDEITNLICPYAPCEYQGTAPITVVSEWIIFHVDSDEYKYIRKQFE